VPGPKNKKVKKNTRSRKHTFTLANHPIRGFRPIKEVNEVQRLTKMRPGNPNLKPVSENFDSIFIWAKKSFLDKIRYIVRINESKLGSESLNVKSVSQNF